MSDYLDQRVRRFAMELDPVDPDRDMLLEAAVLLRSVRGQELVPKARLDETINGHRIAALEAENERLRDRLAAVGALSIYRDNGYEKCRLCKWWSHMSEPILHRDDCPLRAEGARDE